MIRQLDVMDKKIATNILDVQMPAYRVEASIIGFDEIPPLSDTIDTLQMSKETFYGYYEMDVLVGVIGIQLFEQMLDIHRLVVHPDYFRRGIGRELLAFVVKEFENQVTQIQVHTGTKNYPAKNLYNRFGFKEVEQIVISPALSLSMLVRKHREQKETQ
jgi:ribosomal protein S18 acetylase RimI-like enzyme